MNTEPHCIIEPNADDLVKKMVTYMLTIAKNATELTKTKFSDVFETLQSSLIDDGITNEMAEYPDYDRENDK